MQALLALCQNLIDRFDLDTRWEQIKEWLTREDRKVHRRVALACSLIFLSLVILLATTCDGGPQVHP
ncbi:MAG: hypothetical protein AAF750_10875 [Planctomycetota bacterium]